MQAALSASRFNANKNVAIVSPPASSTQDPERREIETTAVKFI